MKKLLKKKIAKRLIAIISAVMIVLMSMWLSVDFANHVKIKDAKKELTLTTYSTNTKKILSQAHIELESTDTVKRKDSGDSIYLEIMRAFPVHIMYHNMEHIELMCYGTVSDALEKADISLNGDDVINHSGETKVYDGMEIVIDEVKYITKTSSKPLSFDTKVKESDSYPVGYEEVEKKGTKGEKEITATYKYVNGEFHSKVGECEQVTKKPKDKVVVKGTGEVIGASNISVAHSSGTAQHGSTSHSGGTSSAGTVNGMSYSKVLTGSATAYTASSGALTSTGVPAYVGGVAVNPNIIPYGSKLYIVADGYTYGYATAVDTGGALMSGTALVDLYMSTYDECINFGRRNVKVYILN